MPTTPSTSEPISYGLGLTRLDENLAFFGDYDPTKWKVQDGALRPANDTMPSLILPVDKWLQLGRPGWIHFTVGAGPLHHEGGDRLL
jgi:hypothetical protein